MLYIFFFESIKQKKKTTMSKIEIGTSNTDNPSSISIISMCTLKSKKLASNPYNKKNKKQMQLANKSLKNFLFKLFLYCSLAVTLIAK